MIYLRNYVSVDDVIGTSAVTPYVGVAGDGKVIFASTANYGKFINLVTDGSDYFKPEAQPQPKITITVESTTDTAVLSLTCDKTSTVKGDVVWTSDLGTDVVKIEGTNLTFVSHYDGDIVLTATADNAVGIKTVTVKCDESVTATTYSLGIVSEIADVEALVTSATVNYTVIPTYFYPMKPQETGNAVLCTKTVEFEANTTESAVTRSGSFEDTDHVVSVGGSGVTVNWSLTQKVLFIPEFVDLGITNSSGKKVLWATCNIGANSPEEYGKYFQWGDTIGYTDASHSTWETAPFNNGSSSYNGTYWNSVSASTVTKDSDGSYKLKSAYDAATVAYGSGYRMPTKAELVLLTANTTYTREKVNDVYGARFTSKEDTTKSIFIPCAGYCFNGSISGKGSYNTTWSSSIGSKNCDFSYGLFSKTVGNDYGRCYAFSIRGVLIQN